MQEITQKSSKDGRFNTSALAEHAWNTDDSVEWSGVTVLEQNKELYPRLALEAYHIQRQPLLLNRDKGFLPSVYDRLLRDC